MRYRPYKNTLKVAFTFISTSFNKFFECFVTFVFLRDLAYSYLPFNLSIFNSLPVYFETLFIGWNLIIVIVIVIFSLLWNMEEGNGKFNSLGLHNWLRLIMCYYAAFLIFQYGWAKVYGSQFPHVYYRDDTLASNLSGPALAWSFFSYSYYFTLLIGLLQITGGMLLLFVKTRLAGTFILLPVMVNILLINVFYGVSTDAFVNAILITTAVSYILWLQRRELILLFLKVSSNVSSKKMYHVKALIRIMVVVFAFTAGYPYKPAGDAAFYPGKWKVVQLIRNGKIVDQQQWQNDPGAWNNVYIEIKRKLFFSANPNYYDDSKKQVQSYLYTVAKNHLLLTRYPNLYDTATVKTNVSVDSAIVTVHFFNVNNMQWNTIMNHDTLQIKLSRDTTGLLK